MIFVTKNSCSYFWDPLYKIYLNKYSNAYVNFLLFLFTVYYYSILSNVFFHFNKISPLLNYLAHNLIYTLSLSSFFYESQLSISCCFFSFLLANFHHSIRFFIF